MSKGQKKSLYWLIVILLMMAGCTQKVIPTETLPIVPSSTPAALGVMHDVEMSATIEPTLTESTVSVPNTVTTSECKKIAFSMFDGLNYDIYSVCPDGSQLVDLTNNPSDDVDPAWSPDGTKIAFSSTRSGHFQIYQMSEDGTDVVLLTNDYENLNPVWLPDGKHIAFKTDDLKGLFWWRALNLETSELTTITDTSYDFFYKTPAWSPDGQKIAYMSLVEQQARNDGSTQIHVKNIDGSNDVALTNDIWANFNPKWSPDGSKIAFLSERGGTYNMFALYIMNEDGTDVQQLTETGFPADVVYSWSPDGKQIAIGGNNLFNGINIIDIDSKMVHPLMEWANPANVFWPSWQP